MRENYSQQLSKLIEKLQKEGLFDDSHKVSIPKYKNKLYKNVPKSPIINICI